MRALEVCREKVTSVLSGRSSIDIPIDKAAYVVLDTELTGLDIKKDSIISIGAVKMHGRSIDLGSSFYRLVNPSAELRHESIVIHGITPSELAEKPPIGEVISELIDFCGGDVIVGHFAAIDLGFIGREVRALLNMRLQNRVLDTQRIHEWIKMNNGSFSRHYAVRSEDQSLFALAREYHVPVSEGHNALSDAFITAQVFQRLLSILPGLGLFTLKDLLRIGKP
ncbi:MAG: 3'-5' exonuclease [Nitrospirota bacterium]